MEWTHSLPALNRESQAAQNMVDCKYNQNISAKSLVEGTNTSNKNPHPWEAITYPVTLILEM